MKVSAFLLSLVISCTSWSNTTFPMHPAPNLTPGSLCQNPDELRYPEKIAYCNRNVSAQTKIDVIETYEHEFNFSILAARPDFKIDHFIPLCMGGSNRTDNLWPQHKSIYEITDPLEFELCQKLAHGNISQAQAVSTIRKAKLAIQLQ